MFPQISHIAARLYLLQDVVPLASVLGVGLTWMSMLYGRAGTGTRSGRCRSTTTRYRRSTRRKVRSMLATRIGYWTYFMLVAGGNMCLTSVSNPELTPSSIDCSFGGGRMMDGN
jgi:hypothetical protein